MRGRVRFVGILLILGSLYQFKGLSLSGYKFFFRDLPYSLIIARYYISLGMIIIGVITAIGLFFLKDIFRRITVFIGGYILFGYLIEGPFLIFKYIPGYVHSLVAHLSSSGIKSHNLYLSVWSPIIFNMFVEFGFGVFLVYYFTRPNIRKIFNPDR